MEAKAEVASVLHSAWLDGVNAEARASLRGFDENAEGGWKRWSLDLWDRDGSEAVVSVVAKGSGEWEACALYDPGCDDWRDQYMTRVSGALGRDDEQADFSLEDYFESKTMGWKRWVGWLKDADGNSYKVGIVRPKSGWFVAQRLTE